MIMGDAGRNIEIKNNEMMNRIIELRYDNNINVVEKTNADSRQYKKLVSDMLNLSQKINKSIDLEKISNCIDSWKESCVNNQWVIQLKEYFSKCKDVLYIYVYCNREVVVVLEDITNDNLFIYNEFCFDLADKYQDINNFMVIDEEEAIGSQDLLRNYDMIYKKG